MQICAVGSRPSDGAGALPVTATPRPMRSCSQQGSGRITQVSGRSPTRTTRSTEATDMALLQAHDVVLDLPKGWDGRIRRREQVDPELAPASRTLATVGRPGHTPVVAQAASVSLPAGTGDFGGGAV